MTFGFVEEIIGYEYFQKEARHHFHIITMKWAHMVLMKQIVGVGIFNFDVCDGDNEDFHNDSDDDEDDGYSVDIFKLGIFWWRGWRWLMLMLVLLMRRRVMMKIEMVMVKGWCEEEEEEEDDDDDDGDDDMVMMIIMMISSPSSWIHHDTVLRWHHLDCCMQWGHLHIGDDCLINSGTN